MDCELKDIDFIEIDRNIKKMFKKSIKISRNDMNNIDIIEIDRNIKKMFEISKESVEIYKKRLFEINKTINNLKCDKYLETLNKNKIKISKIIYNLENDINLNFYIFDTDDLIKKYKEILNIPIKISFVGKPVKNNKSKKKIIKQYLNIASRYIDFDHEYKKNKIICNNCKNKEFEIINNNIYICKKCFSQQSIMIYLSSYNDVSRINMSTKYMYDRKIHFRDCINQYQGKQNNTIPQHVYDDLIEEFNKHHLIDNTITDKYKKFEKITKNHILMFLKELNYTKHYENVNLIHYIITGIKPDDISYLEQKLLDDFDILTNLYDKRYEQLVMLKCNSTRKNFINTQYVLFQLLRKHRHECDKSSFINLKTIDRKTFHDSICKILFEELGWNHEPYY